MMGAGTINIALGLWLMISAFICPHTSSQRMSTSFVGLLVTLVATASLAAPGIRWLNVALAAWLLVTSVVLPYFALAAVWHNVIVALVIGVVSLVAPTRGERLHGTRRRQPA